jgi:uncharacterized protein with FMN-binding domain
MYAVAAKPTVVAVAPKKKVTTKNVTVRGPAAAADRWGDVQVTLIVKKTTTTIGAKKTVARKITKVQVPVYPNHTDRSVYISQNALPMLIQEELGAQFNLARMQLISNATNTSYAFMQSLQAALLQAKRV